MQQKLSYLIATFFYSGKAPFAPGTVGSLATLPLAFVLAYYFGLTGIICGIIISFVLGLVSISQVLKTSKHDPSYVVIDEVAGQLTTFVAVAPYLQNNPKSWPIYIIGFILFRIFDRTECWCLGFQQLLFGSNRDLHEALLFFRVVPYASP